MATNTSVQSGSLNLPGAVPPGGTFSFAYPSGTTQATFTGANAGAAADQVVFISDNDRYTAAAVPGVNGGVAPISINFGAGQITVTNNSGTTWPSGGRIRVGMGLLNMAPILGGKGPAIAALVDQTGGAISNTLAAITAGAAYAQADMVAVKNALASIAAAQATIIAELKTAGVTN